MRIHGVQRVPFNVSRDSRGSLSEVFRSDANGGFSLRQWNWVDSHANVLRGMHAHLRYDEVYVVVKGRMFFLLKDARRSSPTFGREQSFSSDDLSNASLVVPTGVAHGVYFETAGILAYGLSSPWDGEQEYSFRWDDPAVETRWPAIDPLLSERDRSAGSFMDMVTAIESAREPADR